ncbi:hypothetical protein D3C73_944950 [compost metagenome]
MRRQQDAGLGAGNAGNTPDAAQNFIEALQAVGADLHQNIPLAVGGVQGEDRRFATQLLQHAGRLGAFYRHTHPGADAVMLHARFDADGIAGNDPLCFQRLNSFLYSSA